MNASFKLTNSSSKSTSVKCKDNDGKLKVEEGSVKQRTISGESETERILFDALNDHYYSQLQSMNNSPDKPQVGNIT